MLYLYRFMLEWKMAAIIPISKKKNLKFEIYIIFDIYFQKITVRLWFSGTGFALLYKQGQPHHIYEPYMDWIGTYLLTYVGQ